MERKKNNQNWLEWIVTGISAIIVIFTFGFLIWQFITEEQTPPEIVITFGESLDRKEHYAIPLIAENKGAQTAQKVKIEISMGYDEGGEKAHLEFDYVPGKSKVNGWVNFNKNPGDGNLRAKVLGFVVP